MVSIIYTPNAYIGVAWGNIIQKSLLEEASKKG